MPLGALAHLLPAGIGDERCDLVAVMSEVRPVLRDQAANGPLVLFVDDLHLLDTTRRRWSASSSTPIWCSSSPPCGRNEPCRPAWTSLWHRARVRRIDLDDLDRAAVDTLLHLVLQRPGRGEHDHARSGRRARATCCSSASSCSARSTAASSCDQRGVWRLVGPLVATPRLHELVAARLGALEPAATDALDVLAVWEPAGLSTLEAIVGRDQLEAARPRRACSPCGPTDAASR